MIMSTRYYRTVASVLALGFLGAVALLGGVANAQETEECQRFGLSDPRCQASLQNEFQDSFGTVDSGRPPAESEFQDSFGSVDSGRPPAESEFQDAFGSTDTGQAGQSGGGGTTGNTTGGAGSAGTGGTTGGAFTTGGTGGSSGGPGFSGSGLAYEIDSPLNGINSLEGLITAILNVLLIVAIPIIVFFIILAGFNYVTAGGNQEKIKTATRSLTYAVIGAVLILGAVALSEIISGVVCSFSSDPASCRSV